MGFELLDYGFEITSFESGLERDSLDGFSDFNSSFLSSCLVVGSSSSLIALIWKLLLVVSPGGLLIDVKVLLASEAESESLER